MVFGPLPKINRQRNAVAEDDHVAPEQAGIHRMAEAPERKSSDQQGHREVEISAQERLETAFRPGLRTSREPHIANRN